jgi:hypothetical protein
MGANAMRRVGSFCLWGGCRPCVGVEPWELTCETTVLGALRRRSEGQPTVLVVIVDAGAGG